MTMCTTSILSKDADIKSCISIKAFNKKEIVSKSDTTKNIVRSNHSVEKAVVIDMLEYKAIKKSLSVKFTYTIKQGDAKRLSKGGVLRVYNHYEPINIPVEKLLGKWKNTHVGVTLICRGENWYVEGGAVNHSINKEETIVQVAFQRLLRFVKA